MKVTSVQIEQKKGSKVKRANKVTWKKDFKENKILYLLFLPVLIWFVIFNYIPMAGIVMAFQKVSMSNIFKSKWVGLQNFVDLFSNDVFPLALRNTIAMSILSLTIGFSAGIILALIFTTSPHKRFRRFAQSASYVPNFVSAVVVCSLAIQFLARDGAVTRLLTVFGFEQQNWLANPNIPVFWLIYTFIGIWQGAGWGSIIFVASISNISQDLHEAAAIDGANRFKRMTHITLPSLLPLIVMLFILQIGMSLKMVGNNILLLYMPITYPVADVLSTYTYRMAFGDVINYGLSTASGLFQSIVGTVLLVVSNTFSKRTTKHSLF